MNTWNAHLQDWALLAGKMAWQQAAIEPDGAWAEACCTTFADASNRCVSHYVGELEVAGCKLELADAVGVDAHAQKGHAPWQPALWWVSMQTAIQHGQHEQNWVQLLQYLSSSVSAA